MDPAHQKSPSIVKNPRDVAKRLRELGLSLDIVSGTIRAWARAEASASLFEPRNAPGLKGWISGNGFCREHLSLDGWDRVDPSGVPIALNKATGISISVTSGNNVTGLDWGPVQPSTKNPKGAATVAAVLKNAAQLDFPALRRLPAKRPERRTAPKTDTTITWLILVFTDASTETMRGEVSLPSGITGGRVRFWRERILLGDVSEDFDPKMSAVDDDDDDDDDSSDDVPVRRRA